MQNDNFFVGNSSLPLSLAALSSYFCFKFSASNLRVEYFFCGFLWFFFRCSLLTDGYSYYIVSHCYFVKHVAETQTRTLNVWMTYARVSVCAYERLGSRVHYSFSTLCNTIPSLFYSISSSLSFSYLCSLLILSICKLKLMPEFGIFGVLFVYRQKCIQQVVITLRGCSNNGYRKRDTSTKGNIT